MTHNDNKALDGTGSTKQTLYSASVNRSFGRHVSSSLEVRHTQQTSSGIATTSFTGGPGSTTFTTGNYKENAVIGTLRYTFQ